MPKMQFIEPIPKDCCYCPDNTPATHFVCYVKFMNARAGCFCKTHAQMILMGKDPLKN